MESQTSTRFDIIDARIHKVREKTKLREQRWSSAAAEHQIKKLHSLMYSDSAFEHTLGAEIESGPRSYAQDQPKFQGRYTFKKSAQYGWLRGMIVKQFWMRNSKSGTPMMLCRIMYEDGSEETVTSREMRRRVMGPIDHSSEIPRTEISRKPSRNSNI